MYPAPQLSLEADLTLWKIPMRVLDQPAQLDFLSKSEARKFPIGPHLLDGISVTVAHLQKKPAIRGQGMKKLELNAGQGHIANDAKIFVSIGNQLGCAKQQRDARLAALVCCRRKLRCVHFSRTDSGLIMCRTCHGQPAREVM
jgi:hypothetical protein